MASSNKLVLKFGTMSGEKTFTINYADVSADTGDVRALMDGIIANGSVYQYQPLTKISAKIVQTIEKEYSLEG